MLQHEPVHVRDVKGSLRTGLEHDGRNQLSLEARLTLLFIRGTMALKDTIGLHHFAMHEVMNGSLISGVAKSGPNKSSRYCMALLPEVTWLNWCGSLSAAACG